jgi:hypothetical protein
MCKDEILQKYRSKFRIQFPAASIASKSIIYQQWNKLETTDTSQKQQLNNHNVLFQKNDEMKLRSVQKQADENL